jgi:hypothetical protein
LLRDALAEYLREVDDELLSQQWSRFQAVFDEWKARFGNRDPRAGTGLLGISQSLQFAPASASKRRGFSFQVSTKPGHQYGGDDGV